MSAYFFTISFPEQSCVFEYESDPRSNVHYLAAVKKRPEKNSALYGIWTHDLCDTGAALYQLS